MQERSFPWNFMDEVLIRPQQAGAPPVDCPCVFRDGVALGASPSHSELSLGEYRHALDRRGYAPIKALCAGSVATVVVVLHGRQVGTLGSTVATGRTFRSLAHLVVPRAPSREDPIVVQSELMSKLTRTGVCLHTDRPESMATFVAHGSVRREDLLDGDLDATYWARAWRLPSRLARLAVQLMAGLSVGSIGERSELSIKTVRTYSEQLFTRAGIHRRSELAPAALRAGRLLEGA